MIKTLLNADEDPPPGTKVIVEETVLNPPPPLAEPQTIEEIPAQNTIIEENAPENTAAVGATENFEIPEDAKFFTNQSENAEDAPPLVVEETTSPLDEDSESLTALMSKIENLEPEEFERLEREIENASVSEPVAESYAAPVNDSPAIAKAIEPPVEAEKTPLETPEAQTIEPPNLFENEQSPVFEETSEKKSADTDEPTIFQSDYKPPTTAETIRNSGLAWSAGIVFFAAVVFMMIFGWFADLLFGSSPWGLVGGIVFGGIIGFIQFFRITSQIFKK